MMHSEFETLTGVSVSAEEYVAIEAHYMSGSDNKEDFCRSWKKQYNKRIADERKRMQDEHSVYCLFAFMDGVTSIGTSICRSDSGYDKETLRKIDTCGQTLYWCVRQTGTELFIDKEDYEKWCVARGNRDDFAQYKIAYLGDGMFDISRIK